MMFIAKKQGKRLNNSDLKSKLMLSDNVEILFITSNQSKFEWAKRRLEGLQIRLVKKELKIDEPQDMDVEKVAVSKAQSAAKIINEPFIMEDTSFCIPTLNNFPGTFAKFVIQAIGIKGILKLLEGEVDRKAIFRSALVFFKDGALHTFICDDIGTISESPRGDDTKGFNDLFKIFIPANSDKTLAEMDGEEFALYERGIESGDHYHKFGEWIAKNK